MNFAQPKIDSFLFELLDQNHETDAPVMRSLLIAVAQPNAAVLAVMDNETEEEEPNDEDSSADSDVAADTAPTASRLQQLQYEEKLVISSRDRATV